MGETDEDQLEHVLEVLNEASSPREPFDEMEFWYARQKWNDLDDDRREVLKTLTGFNLTESEVKRVMDSLGYRETSIPVTYDELEENLYLLSEKDEGDDEGSTIGFETIDRGIRIDLQELEGHPPGFLRPVRREDKRRVRALLRDVLETAADNGDTLLALDEAVRRTERHLPEERKCSPTVGRIKEERDFYAETLLVSERDEVTTIALPQLDEMEDEISERVTELAANTLETEEIDWRPTIDDVLGSPTDTELREETEETARAEKANALETIHESRLSILKGGAGTGKTTVVSAFLRGLKEVQGRQSKLLLAPTEGVIERLPHQRAG